MADVPGAATRNASSMVRTATVRLSAPCGLLEAAFDPSTTRPSDCAPSPSAGWACLEAGAGAGTIANWLAGRVGPTGRVVALDVDPRFLTGAHPANVEVVRGDVRQWEGASAFDLVHARYVLVHIADSDRALAQMVRSLRPGGCSAPAFPLPSPGTASPPYASRASPTSCPAPRRLPG